MAPGTREQWHVHASSDQLLYVLAGIVTLRTSAGERPLEAGDAVHIQRGLPHQIANTSAEEARFLLCSQPSSRGDRQEIVPTTDEGDVANQR
jgi:quercetin dioxygenase-like cupin family protein